MDQKSFTEFLGEVATYLSVLAPGLLARPLLEWTVAFRDQAIETSEVTAYEVDHGNPIDWILKEVSEALGLLLHKVCRGSGSQAQSSFEDRRLQRLAGVGVLVPGEVHE